MTTKAEWTALAERCEKATGPDQKLDAAIELALGRQVEWHVVSGEWNKHPVQLTSWGGEAVPDFTRSLDAITALIERELPEMQWLCRPDAKGGFGNLYPKSHFDLVDYPIWPSYAATPALALCAAFAKAMAEKAA